MRENMKIAPEVAEVAEWLEEHGLDPYGEDGRELTVELRWFTGSIGAVGICEPLAGEVRKMFIRHVVPLMGKAKQGAKPCEKAEVNHDENHC